MCRQNVLQDSLCECLHRAWCHGILVVQWGWIRHQSRYTSTEAVIFCGLHVERNGLFVGPKVGNLIFDQHDAFPSTLRWYPLYGSLRKSLSTCTWVLIGDTHEKCSFYRYCWWESRSSAQSRAGPWYRDVSFQQRRWREISLLHLRRPSLLQVYYFKWRRKAKINTRANTVSKVKYLR